MKIEIHIISFTGKCKVDNLRFLNRISNVIICITKEPPKKENMNVIQILTLTLLTHDKENIWILLGELTSDPIKRSPAISL